jgi:hypothetical protein
MLAMMHPLRDTYNLTYVYDDFTWGHCQEIGVDIEHYFDVAFEANA